MSPNTLPAGYRWDESPANQGANDETDGANLTIDFGYFKKLSLSAKRTAAGNQTAGNSTWSVTATKTQTTGNHRVTRTIVVSNPERLGPDFTWSMS